MKKVVLALALLAVTGCGSHWPTVRIASGAAISYPPGWRLIRGDPGTATAVLLHGHRFVGYLNLTPRQGEETVANWRTFRPEHNVEEGDRDVRTLPTKSPRGTCVRDAYTTATGTRYIELACLVPGRHPSVVVGAAPPSNWSAISPLLKRAIASVQT
jgi:hypothetical protein